MNRERYSVSGLTCGGCVSKVQATLAQYAEFVKVTLDPPIASFENASIGLAEMNHALGGKYVLIDNLQTAKSQQSFEQPKSASWFSTYYPLLLIIGFITLVSLLSQFSMHNEKLTFSINTWMMHFMAGFFIVFSFFKLLDIKSFADSYAMYDLLAKRMNSYGLIYPFIELGLGIAYLLAWQPVLTNLLTFLLMTFSSIGVVQSVMNKQKIRCACLGSVFNLPMSTVTIIEDLAMAGMALIMLLQSMN